MKISVSEKDSVSERERSWTPPPRPDWVEKINKEGRCMDIKGIVPLDENSLIENAKANTGLSDFGDDNWYEPFGVLVRSLDEEANLNLVGRLMNRSDVLNYLEQRLKIEDTYKRHPEIDEQEIVNPMLIVGQGRSGTSVLQNMLSQDPDVNSLLQWMASFPCPPPESANVDSDPRIAVCDQRIKQIPRVVPEVTAMHEFAAELPIENPFLHFLCFRTLTFFNAFGGYVPSYTAYMQTQDLSIQYEYEKRVLKLLQWKNPCRNWVVKSPTAMMEFPALLKVFPDVRLVWIHRDPVKALSSMINLAGTLFWARTDQPAMGDALAMYTNAQASAQLLNGPIDMLEDGVLKKETLCNVQYLDFMKNPVGVAESIYGYFDIEMTDVARNAMGQYMRDNPRSSRPVHKYDLGDAEQIDKDRVAYKRYQDYFNVPDEV